MTAFRARDTDRATCGIALDAAYADGQLDFDEHTLRQDRCDAATTLDDLRALIADLQVAADLPPEQEPSTPTVRARRVVYVGAALLVLAAGIGAWIAFGGSSAPSPIAAQKTPVEVTAGDVKPIVAPKVDFTSVEGLTRFRELYATKFGDSLTDSVTFFPLANYAVVTRETTPGREQSYVFRGGFSRTSDEAARRSSAVVDLGAIDVAALVSAMNSAPDTLRVPGALIGSVQYDLDSAGAPSVEIYAADPAGSGGSIALTPAGAQSKVYSSAF